MAKSDPIRDAIQKALKMAGKSAKTSASSATKTLTKAERKAINQAKAVADRAAKTEASRASRAERKVLNRKKYAEEADAAVATRYGRGDTRLQKAKGEVATEIDRIFRVAEGTDPIVRRTGARRKAVEKAINKMQDYMTQEGYGKLSFGEKVRIAKDTISGAKRANVAASKRLEGTVKYYKEKESAALKKLSPKTLVEGQMGPRGKTPKNRQAVREVRQAKKEGRETVIREAARRAIRKEAKGQKLVDVSDAKIMAEQAQVDKALAVSRQKKLMAQAKKKRLAEMQDRAPSKRGVTEKAKEEAARAKKAAKKLESKQARTVLKSQAPRGQEKALAELEKTYNRGLITKEKYLINRKRIINTRPRLTAAEKEASLRKLARDKGSAMKRNKPVQRYGNPAERIRSKKK